MVNTKHIISTEEAKKVEQMLDRIGFKADKDYYRQDVYDVTIYYECHTRKILTENEVERHDWHVDYASLEVEDELHRDKRKIGCILTSTKDEIIDIAAVEKLARKAHVAGHSDEDKCAICGKRVVEQPYGGDRRREMDGLKCFDHAGVRVDGVPEPKVRVVPELPVIVKKGADAPKVVVR